MQNFAMASVELCIQMLLEIVMEVKRTDVNRCYLIEILMNPEHIVKSQ